MRINNNIEELIFIRDLGFEVQDLGHTEVPWFDLTLNGPMLGEIIISVEDYNMKAVISVMKDVPDANGFVNLVEKEYTRKNLKEIIKFFSN